MIQQRPRHLLVGGADVDEQRGIVRDMLGAKGGDPLLFGELLDLARTQNPGLRAGAAAIWNSGMALLVPSSRGRGKATSALIRAS